MPRLFLSVLIALFLPFAALAGKSVTTPHAKVTLLSDVKAVQAGEPFWLAVRFDLADDWHIYWRNPGDSGLSPRLKWKLPEGFRTRATHWPAPERIEVEGLMNYGYNEEATLLVPIVPPKELAEGEALPIHLKADWLICKDVCIPESGEMELSLGVNTSGDAAWSEMATDIEAERQRLPKVLDRKGSWQATKQKITFSFPLEVDSAKLQEAYFFPGLEGVIEHAEPQQWQFREDGMFEIAVKRGTASLPKRMNGVLALYQEQGEILYYFVRLEPNGAMTVPEKLMQETGPEKEKPVAPAEEKANWWQALFFALLGGLLLNAMPCVFPVLSLKALAISKKAAAEGSAVRKQGLAYLAGTVSSFMLLAAILIGLKSGGEVVGWGFQLQSPVFVAAMIYLFLLLGLSLAGMFELPQMLGGLGNEKASKDSMSGSFFTGILAVLVATPCTVPFMAPALSYAFAQSAAVTLSIMAVMGLGLALPYLLVSFYPSIQHRLPKPGPWMQTFKEFMAFPIFATAAWLFWVLAQQVSVVGMAVALAMIVLLPYCLWLGKRKPSALQWGIGIIALLLVVYSFSAFDPKAPKREEISYSVEKLTSLREAGTPVYLDATAAWCITCKVNERVALSSQKVTDAFNKQGIVYMVADWTNHDPAITRLLEEYDHQGVPLNVYFPPKGRPVVLPQLLTESIVLNAIKGETP